MCIFHEVNGKVIYKVSELLMTQMLATTLDILIRNGPTNSTNYYSYGFHTFT